MKRWLLLVTFSLICSMYPASPLVASPERSTVKMEVKRIFLDPSSKTPVVILESEAKSRFIPIWIGKAEATSIAIQLEHVKIPRPNTHDLIRNILQGVGAVLHRITITDLRDNTYFAVITLKLNGQEIQIDSRPSDAIAVALRMKAPIYASSQVLAKTHQWPSGWKERQGVRKILGFHIQDLTADLANFFNVHVKLGVLVADVDTGSAASKAGFKRGDVITKVNGKAVHSVDQLESFIRGMRGPGRLEVEVEREGKPVHMELNLPS